MSKQHIQQVYPGRYEFGPKHRLQQGGQQPVEAREGPERQEETRKKPGRSQEEARKRPGRGRRPVKARRPGTGQEDDNRPGTGQEEARNRPGGQEEDRRAQEEARKRLGGKEKGSKEARRLGRARRPGKG